jgi:ATP-dependent DNA helicase RecQ
MSTSSILQHYWGFESLRPLQQEVVEAAVAGRDALVVMPTGGGKSLCFQLPPLVTGGLTLVISPLISLMKDQVDGLRLVGYPAGALHSGIGPEEAEEIRVSLISGSLKLLYVSPERVLTPAMLALLNEADEGRGVARIAIDEAHCISQWGHDFRPEYRQLSRLRSTFPKAPIHALTATATPRVREDVIRQLGLRDAEQFVGVFDRPNLTYRIAAKNDSVKQIAAAINAHPKDASIVYCISRKDTEKITAGLKTLKVNAAAYHAGLDSETRSRVSEDFAQERVNVVVATVAFGMGIDRANVRLVVHESLPKSIEGYQQETGRAGRDGLPSECLMLYDPNDVMRWERVISMDASADNAAHQRALIDEVRRFAIGTECRHGFLSRYFGQELEGECGGCDICLDGWKPVENGTKYAQQIIATVLDIVRGSPNFGFGVAHIAGILHGKDTKQIRAQGHENLRGYAAMKSIPADQIGTWLHQLIDQGLLRRTGDKFPTVGITEEGVERFRSRSEIVLRDVDLPQRRAARAARGTVGVRPASFDETLFEALRALRREIAVERSVPAYVVFQDASLIAMASQRPSTLESFMAISGVGEKRGQDFGPAFLRVIRSHAEERGLPMDLARGEDSPAEEPAPTRLNPTALRLRPCFDEAVPLEEISEKAGLSTVTIRGYLVEWIAEFRPETVAAWVDDSTVAKVRKVLSVVDGNRLKPVYEALNGEVDYDSISIAMAFLRTMEIAV